jgi:hypothetical protein
VRQGAWLACRIDRLCGFAVLFVAAALAFALLVVAGGPIATDDTWWHLAHGAAFAHQGPWLTGDPLLFTAPGPPAPASWLADVGLHAVLTTSGFTGLRLLHAGLVAAIVALAFAQLRAAAGSRGLGAAACALFIMFASYRLIQLRPELVSLLATLLLARTTLESASPAAWPRLAFVAGLCAVWSNLHAGFLLGPALIAVAAASLVLAAPLRSPSLRRSDLRRARGLGAALAAGLLGSLANPAGLSAYRPLLAAGRETPALPRVADEWTSLDLLAWPDPSASPPAGVVGWAMLWALLVATGWIALRCARSWRRDETRVARAIDPARLGLAAASLVAMLLAVRFLWLAIFPLLLVAHALRATGGTPVPGRWQRLSALALTLALAIGFFRVGDGRRWLAQLPRSSEAYAAPFDAARYFAHSAWLLHDTEVEGRLFADYFLGGFLGYWLAPRVRCFVNGSLNLAPDAMAANLPLRTRRGQRPGESFLELLDRHGIDLYLGTRLPEQAPPGRPWFVTTAHLEGASGWIPIFRNLRSALYLRDNPGNADNLLRVSEYYARKRVPFDPAVGFDVARVIREAPSFAVARGVVPRHIEALVAARDGVGGGSPRQAAGRLATLYAVLGLYDQAIALDRRPLGKAAGSLASRRLVWSLLRRGRTDEALAVVQDATPAPGPASLWRPLAEAARGSGQATRLPFLTRGEARRMLSGFVHPATREPRDHGSR